MEPNLAVDKNGNVWALYRDPVTGGAGYIAKHSGIDAIPLLLHEIPSQNDLRNITYSSEQNKLFIQSGTDKLLRYDIATDTIDATLSGLVLLSSAGNGGAFRNGPTKDETIYLRHVGGGGDIIEIDLTTMETIRFLSTSSWISPTVLKHILYDELNHALIMTEHVSVNGIWLFLDRLNGGTGTTTVKAVVEDISDRVGLDIVNDIDASALTQIVRGYILTNRMSARKAIEPLMPLYFFDAAESDHIIKFVNRGGASALSLDQDDVGAVSNLNSVVPILNEARQQEPELPERLDLLYADPASDYQVLIQHAKRIREAVDTVSLVTINAPIAFLVDEAKQIIEKMLYTLWTERDTFELQTHWEHIQLDPTDILTFTKDGVTFRIYLTEVDWGQDGTLALRGLKDKETTYESFSVGVDSKVPTQTIVVSGSSEFFVMDTPLFQDVDEGFIMYYAAGAWGAESWPGAVIYESDDNSNFNSIFGFVPKSANIDHGFASTLLADTNSPWTWDRINTITVYMRKGILASDIEIDVLNGSNVLMVGDEIVQFATSVLNADGSFTVSDLIRGRRGTEFATSTHAIGDRIIVLTDLTIFRKMAASESLNTTRFYKAATFGGLLVGPSKSLQYSGNSKKPYSPAHISGDNTGSPDDWVFSWFRRTRLRGQWVDNVDVILGEDTEDYEVDIIDETGSPEEVIRTITTTTSAGGSFVDASNRQCTYSQADQITDFGAPLGTVRIRVFQMSAAVGRGFVEDITIIE